MSCTHFKKRGLVDKRIIVVPEGRIYFGNCTILGCSPHFDVQLRLCNSDAAFVQCEHYQNELKRQTNANKTDKDEQ